MLYNSFGRYFVAFKVFERAMELSDEVGEGVCLYVVL